MIKWQAVFNKINSNVEEETYHEKVYDKCQW